MQSFIHEQPAALRRLLDGEFEINALKSAFAARAIRKAWILGSGTSLYAAMIAAEYWERRLGIDAEAISSLEFSNSASAAMLGPDTAVIGISQSGATFILVDGIRRARHAGCLTVGITAEPGALLGSVAEFVVPTFTGPEDAMGKTKGFTTTALAGCLVGRHLAPASARLPDFDDLPDAAARVIDEVEREVDGWVPLFAETQAIFAVGAGDLLPAAWEGGLKILEVAKQVVVTKELEEMLHGPFNAVGPTSSFVLLSGRVGQVDRLQAFLKGVAALALPLLMIGNSEISLETGAGPGARYALPRLKEPSLDAVLAVVPMQILADRLARARNLDPDTARYPFLYKILAAKSIYV